MEVFMYGQASLLTLTLRVSIFHPRFIYYIHISIYTVLFFTQGIFLKSFVNTTVEESCLFREKLNVNEEPPWDPS